MLNVLGMGPVFILFSDAWHNANCTIDVMPLNVCLELFTCASITNAQE